MTDKLDTIREMMEERLKRMLEQDIDWMWEEGFYTLANRLERVLKYIEQLEKKNETHLS